ncbi:MAG: hypothetical protein ACM3ST_10860 [Bdellovibrio bacteriovorus]
MKQLTRAHLELLGLPEGAGVAGSRAEALPSPSRAADPSTGADLDRQPLDLRALAREVRLELEITLGLLEGAAGQAPTD